MRKDLDVAVDMLYSKAGAKRGAVGFIKILGTAEGLKTYTNIASALLPKTCGGWPVIILPVNSL